MERASYEHACQVWSPSCDALLKAAKEDRVEVLMAHHRAELAKVGWTPAEILEESRRRMLEKIETLRKEECVGNGNVR